MYYLLAVDDNGVRVLDTDTFNLLSMTRSEFTQSILSKKLVIENAPRDVIEKYPDNEIQIQTVQHAKASMLPVVTQDSTVTLITHTSDLFKRPHYIKNETHNFTFVFIPNEKLSMKLLFGGKFYHIRFEDYYDNPKLRRNAFLFKKLCINNTACCSGLERDLILTEFGYVPDSDKFIINTKIANIEISHREVSVKYKSEDTSYFNLGIEMTDSELRRVLLLD